jgi:hypothetical protein
MKVTADSDAGPVAVLARRLRFQSAACAQLGSPLYADLLGRSATDLDAGGPTLELLRGHEQDPGPSALALRLMGAVHRLVLAGELPRLAALYADPERDPEQTWTAFVEAIAARREDLAPLVELPVQTNEVGRCAALLVGFLAVAERTGMPLRLLELGSSAGLNQLWDRYRYEAEGFAWGSPSSPLKIAFELAGSPPESVPVEVAERRGCDPAPVDPTSEQGRLTLLSYVWADQAERLARVDAAIAVAREEPPTVERAGAAAWLDRQLAEPRPGVATVVFHSIVMQYLSPAERRQVEARIRAAGERATGEAPLAWLRMEPAGDLAELRLSTWPGGEERRLGVCGYHGSPLRLA